MWISFVWFCANCEFPDSYYLCIIFVSSCKCVLFAGCEARHNGTVSCWGNRTICSQSIGDVFRKEGRCSGKDWAAPLLAYGLQPLHSRRHCRTVSYLDFIHFKLNSVLLPNMEVIENFRRSLLINRLIKSLITWKCRGM